jgi:hypothetical protein
MAENFRRGDRVEWHNRPQFTTDPQETKRANGEKTANRESIGLDDGGEGSIPTDRR